MKNGRISDIETKIDIEFQGKLPGKSNITACLLDKHDQFTISEYNKKACCIYQYHPALTLSPYDVACMRHAKKLTSSEFFSKYAKLSFEKENQFPRVFFNSDFCSKKKIKRCPFLIEDKGNRLDARPLGCRLYPVIRAVDANNVSFFALIELTKPKSSRNAKTFTLKSWLKNIHADKWLMESDRYESLLNTVINQEEYEFSNQEKTDISSMVYTPDAFASDDLFGYMLKKPELALEALEFGYAQAKGFVSIRTGFMKKN